MQSQRSFCRGQRYLGRLRLKLYVFATVLGVSMVYAAGFFVPSLEDFRTNPDICQTPCWSALLMGLVGLVLTFVGGTKALFEYLTQEGYIQKGRTLAKPQIGTGQEDNEILEMANELRGRMILPGAKLATVLGWAEHLPWDWYEFKRQGWRKPPMLLLSSSLQGKLSLEDWRNLLIYCHLREKPNRKLILEIILLGMFPLLLLPLGGVAVASIYGIQGGRLYGQFVAGPTALLILIQLLRSCRKWFLKMDRLAAGYMGREVLLDLLQKVDNLSLPDLERGKRRRGWVARIWPMPNITERIQNLQIQTTVESSTQKDISASFQCIQHAYVKDLPL